MTNVTDHIAMNQAQVAALSAALIDPDTVWETLTPLMFDDGPYRRAAWCLHGLWERKQPVTVEAVVSEGLTRGWTIDPFALFGSSQPADRAVTMLLDATGRLGVHQEVIRATQHLDRGVDAWRVADDLIDNLHALPRPAQGLDGVPWWTWDEVMGFRSDTDEYVIPRMLSKGERLVLTGIEGFGKTTLLYQLALGAAFGVNPTEHTETFDPRKVMILDVENWHETQVREQMTRLGGAYKRWTRLDGAPDVVLLKPRTIDLLDPGNRRTILSAVEMFQPDLLYMGSGYKLADANDEWRVIASAIQRTADQARASSGCAVMIETHAGHGFKGDRNGGRPDGSSFWLRWPEFGYFLDPVKGQEGIPPVRMASWRGDRVRDRAWPGGWTPGGVLPWTAISKDEWDVRFPTDEKKNRY